MALNAGSACLCRRRIYWISASTEAGVSPGSVRRHTLRLHFQPHKPFVRHDELQMGRLGDDRPIRAVVLRHRQRAFPGKILVHHRAEDHIAAQRQLPGRGHRQHAGRHTAFHVVRAAPVQAAGAQLGLVGAGHPANIDSIHVSVAQQGFSTAAAACNGNHVVGPVGGGCVQVHFQPGVFQPEGDEGGNLCLTSR